MFSVILFLYLFPPGLSKIITDKYIKSKLKQITGRFDEINANYKEKIKVTTDYNVITGEELIKTAETFLSSNIKDINNELSIVSPQSAASIIVPKGLIELAAYTKFTNNAQLNMLDTKLFGLVIVNIDITINNKLYRKLRLNFILKLNKEVVTAGKRLLPGDILSIDNIILKKVSMYPEEINNVYSNLQDLIGQVVVTYTDEKTVITKNMIRMPYTVKKGDKVKIVINMPGLALSTIGNALESGILGQVIKAKNLDSGKIILCKVIDSKTLCVEMKRRTRDERRRTRDERRRTKDEGRGTKRRKVDWRSDEEIFFDFYVVYFNYKCGIIMAV
ncbi:flagellar basal body P-ring formation protein FlgA [Candidatus Desantisbacteria bacterium]|nr:flagellar basal body P-ring formation protein FlgA [Candidatus Desantisbacteria bacterium]